MFRKKIIVSFEGSPLEIIRKYAPYLVGAFAGVSILLLLYEQAYYGGVDILDETNDGVTDIIGTSTETTNELIEEFGP
jgi:hypothetical protein